MFLFLFISLLIYYILGFNRAPPSVMRNITIGYLDSIIEKTSSFFPLDKRYYVLDQLFPTCSDKGMLIGSMTGWYNFYFYSKEEKFLRFNFKGGAVLKMVKVFLKQQNT